MKKRLIKVSLLFSSLLMADTSTDILQTALQDMYEIHNYSKSKMETLANSDTQIAGYAQKIEAYEKKFEIYTEKLANESFQTKEDAQKALDQLNELSSELVVLSKSVAYLASHQADNANESYNNSIELTSKTILRLSDDIGVMADRILLMAKEIGIMADRILETQEIQSRNLAATQQLSRYAMTLTNGQINTTRESANTNLNSGFNTGINSAQSMQMQNSSQGFIGMH
jgi:HAMP domain-containing protein